MSDYSKSTNFTTKDTLPTGNSGKIVKGTELDVEFTNISSAITSKANSDSPTFTGVPITTTAVTGTNTTQIASCAFVLANSVPSGLISLWSGSIASVPSGWYLCNGANGTPDLRDKFVVGAGSTYAVAATGGSANAVVVSHTHTATSTVSDPSHTHNNQVGIYAINGSGGVSLSYGGSGAQAGNNIATDAATTGISVSTTNSTTGVSATNANLPPYYALAYIMKA